jgi:hypothetical protein
MGGPHSAPQKPGGLAQEHVPFDARLEARPVQAGEQKIHLRTDVLGKAEPVAILRRADGPVAPGPRIDVAKEMPVDAPIVCRPETPGRQGLRRAQARHFEFERLEDVRIKQTQAILQTVRALVTVGIIEGVVGAGASLRLLKARVRSKDSRAPLLDRRAAFHAFAARCGQLEPFDGADRRKGPRPKRCGFTAALCFNRPLSHGSNIARPRSANRVPHPLPPHPFGLTNFSAY